MFINVYIPVSTLDNYLVITGEQTLFVAFWLANTFVYCSVNITCLGYLLYNYIASIVPVPNQLYLFISYIIISYVNAIADYHIQLTCVCVCLSFIRSFILIGICELGTDSDRESKVWGWNDIFGVWGWSVGQVEGAKGR